MPTEPHLERANAGRRRPRSRVHQWVTVALVMAGLTLGWVVLTPPGAGADEPSHLTRAAALIRDTPGQPENFESRERYLLPDWIEIPEPACYAFQPGVSAACAPLIVRTGALVELSSRADEYPPGAHLVYGVATLVPGIAAIWPARLIGALIISGLLAASLVVRRRRGIVAASGLFVALTPMAWGTFAIVNPSSLTIVGATALWVALIELALQHDTPGRHAETSIARLGRSDRLTAWLFVAGWITCLLPRRDGTIWACLIVAIVVIVADLPIVTIAQSIGPWASALAATTMVAMTLWAATNESPVTRLMAVAPLVLIAAEAVRRWRDVATTTLGRWLPIMATVLATAAAFAFTAVRRPGGANSALVAVIIRETPRHLNEAIGVLGWLDASIPRPAAWGWVGLVVIALWGAARAADKRWFVAAVGTLAVAIVSSWMFELASGSDSGRYWQGRYSLPLLVGIALLATTRRRSAHEVDTGRERGEAMVLTVGSLLLTNVAAWAVSRRWAVGVEGPLWIGEWPITIMPIRPIYPLIALALVSVGAAVIMLGSSDPGATRDR